MEATLGFHVVATTDLRYYVVSHLGGHRIWRCWSRAVSQAVPSSRLQNKSSWRNKQFCSCVATDSRASVILLPRLRSVTRRDVELPKQHKVHPVNNDARCILAYVNSLIARFQTVTMRNQVKRMNAGQLSKIWTVLWRKNPINCDVSILFNACRSVYILSTSSLFKIATDQDVWLGCKQPSSH